VKALQTRIQAYQVCTSNNNFKLKYTEFACLCTTQVRSGWKDW